jgi:magnesium transporter
MPFKAYYLTPEGDLQRGLNEADVRAAFESRASLLWVDVSETTPEDGEFLERVFHFHPLAVEDCVTPQLVPPKVEQYGDHLFIVVHGINYTTESDIVETTELALFLGPHYVVSNHNFYLHSVEAVQRLVEEGGAPLRRSADFLAYELMDTLVRNVLPTIEKMGDVADEIEEKALQSPQPAHLQAILHLKRSTQRIHRVIAPQEELVSRLSRGEFPLVGPEAQAFYRDIHDHLVWIEDMNLALGNRADNVFSVYFLAAANRQNETMKAIAIMTAVFLPLTLITGVYGMNFAYMPELEWRWGYFAVLGVLTTVAGATLWWVWARQWIRLGRKEAARRISPFAVETERLLGQVVRPSSRRMPPQERPGPAQGPH